MHEILFRGKRTDNGEWVEGYYSNLGGNSPRILKENIFIGKRGRVLEFENIKVLPETVGQFTGLYDKNGKKIFEGDIVELGITYEISYIKKYARFAGRNSSCIFSSLPFDRVRVIGNIHDNSELLETAAKPAAKNIAQSGLAPASENFEIMEV